MAPLLACPCCGLPTLRERASYEICAVCWWEDDGQDDPRASEVWGGPNGRYSLAEARANYRAHGHKYELGKGISAVEKPSKARTALLAYVRAAQSGMQHLDAATLQRLLEHI
jgi:hypothetical protein